MRQSSPSRRTPVSNTSCYLSHLARRRRNSLQTSVILLGALVAAGAACASQARAQCLTARPHQMVLGTRTEEAGQSLLDAYDDSVYIPPQAVGEKRVPLVIAFGSGVGQFRTLADQFG